jgi:hypothetical protein
MYVLKTATHLVYTKKIVIRISEVLLRNHNVHLSFIFSVVFLLPILGQKEGFYGDD